MGSNPTADTLIFLATFLTAGCVKILPTARLELAIFGLGDRRLIHWATRAVCLVGGESMVCQKALPPGKVGRVLSTLIEVTQPDLFYTAFGLAS